MSVITINKPYEQALAETKPTLESVIRLSYAGFPQIVGFTVIPPLNTNILIPENYRPKLGLRAELPKLTLPKSWNWRDKSINDSDVQTSVKTKKLITSPQDQQRCGSCWAMATATAISDTFAIKNGINPNLSATYCLSCDTQQRQNKCGGGHPFKLLEYAQSNGIASNHCVDYSWCENNRKCLRNTQNPNVSDAELNTTVPTCGCYFPTNDHFLYYINNLEFVTVDRNVDAVEKVKQHIFSVGPVIGSFNTLTNFTGNLQQTNGIYIDSHEYNNVKNPKWSGGHAVAILGWGVDSVILDNTMQQVNYWFCRNTWGENWGDNGYFKIAMYPTNTKSVLEKTVTLIDDGKEYVTGGIYLFDPDLRNFAKFSQNNYTGPKINDNEWYKKDFVDISDIEKDAKEMNSRKRSEKIKSRMIIVIILVWIFGMWKLAKIFEIKNIDVK